MVNKHLGPLLGLCGLLLALAAAAKPPAGAWPDTLPCAAGGYGLALVGVALWRRQPQPLWAEATPADTEEETAMAGGKPLPSCVAALQALQERLPTLTMEAVLPELEAIHNRWVVPLSRTQSLLTVGVDREQGLACLALFAQGELWLNRARSTAGDRHRAETQRSVALALENLLAVQQRLEAAAS